MTSILSSPSSSYVRRLVVVTSLSVFGCSSEGAESDAGACAAYVQVAASDSPPTGSGPISATMNDVSILFPLPSSEEDVPSLLGACSAGMRGVLLPLSLYQAIGPISGSTVRDGGNVPADFTSFAEYSDLRVVAMRIDPCFASLDPDPGGTGCTAQLRLVLQEVTVAGSAGITAFDSALHIFYTLTRAEFLDLARGLVALRANNSEMVTLGPLAPHPIMVRQGLRGLFSTGVQQLILRYVGEENLTRVARLDIVDGILSWRFNANNVSNATIPETSPLAIPTLSPDAGLNVDDAGAVVLQGFGTGGGLDPFMATFFPATSSSDNLTPLDDGMPTQLSESARQAAFDSLVSIENPRDNSPNTIDCASCHIAASTENLIAKPLLSLDDETSPLAFQPNRAFVSSADMAATFNTADERLDVHAFSYVARSPSISQRVVNETASVVAYLNQLPSD